MAAFALSEMIARKSVCVDGFNLSYRALKRTNFKWLNPVEWRLVVAAVSTDRGFDGNRWSYVVNFCSFPWSLARKPCRSA